LREWLPEATRRGLSRVALLAVASLRRDEATTWLLGVVRDEPPALAREALQALGSLGGQALGAKAREAAAARPELAAGLAKVFPDRPEPKDPGDVD